MPFKLSSKSMFRFLQSGNNLVTAAVADSVMQSSARSLFCHCSEFCQICHETCSLHKQLARPAADSCRLTHDCQAKSAADVLAMYVVPPTNSNLTNAVCRCKKALF